MQKVLIVDDDRTMASLLRTLLQLDGFDPLIVPHGAQVLDAARAEKPAIILMDVHLADADGLDVLQAIRGDAELAHLPVIMSSGQDLGSRCRQLGAAGFILKPYPPKELLAMLKRVIADHT